MDFKEMKSHEFSFVYISRKDCSVCDVILPQVKEISENYEKSKFFMIELNETPEAAGEFSVFSIPALIVYSQGKELYRGARFFYLEELKEKLDRDYKLIFE